MTSESDCSPTEREAESETESETGREVTPQLGFVARTE